MERNPRIKALDARLKAAHADEAAATLPPNPEASLSREQVGAGGGSQSDTFAELGWTVDAAGRRRLARKASHEARLSEESLVRWEVHALRADVLQAFHELLWAQEHQRELEAGARRLQSLVQSVRTRAGQTADYDRLRLERELAQTQTAARRFQSESVRARGELSTFLGADVDPDQLKVEGDLAPKGRLPSSQAMRAAAQDHPRLQALLRRAEQKRLERDAARRRWLSEIGIHGGLKVSKSPGASDSGFVAGVSLPLPIFDRGQAEAGRKTAEREETLSLHEAENVEIRNALSQTRERARIAVETLESHRSSVLPQAERLEQMSGVGYLEGRIEILQLIDAYQGGTAARTLLLELALEARQASIDLERMLGMPIENVKETNP
jgi:cobalt-zinc-cadmium efflux system outer membrane protein